MKAKKSTEGPPSPSSTSNTSEAGGRGKTLRRRRARQSSRFVGWGHGQQRPFADLEKSAVGFSKSQVLLRRDGGVEDVCYPSRLEFEGLRECGQAAGGLHERSWNPVFVAAISGRLHFLREKAVSEIRKARCSRNLVG